MQRPQDIAPLPQDNRSPGTVVYQGKRPVIEYRRKQAAVDARDRSTDKLSGNNAGQFLSLCPGFEHGLEAIEVDGVFFTVHPYLSAPGVYHKASFIPGTGGHDPVYDRLLEIGLIDEHGVVFPDRALHYRLTILGLASILPACLRISLQ